MQIAIIGAGNMGGAIARGLAKGSIFKEEEIRVTARSRQTLEKLQASNPGFTVSTSNPEAIKDADIIVLAVKPWLLDSVLRELRPHLDSEKQMLVSVVAAVTFDDLQEMLGEDKGGTLTIFRVIPNTAIAVEQSMTLIASRNASSEQEAKITAIFDELGKSLLIEERLMAPGTALCSCGIAYAFKYIKANIDGGVELGFYPEQVKKMILQTMRGAVALMEANQSMPEEEIYRVTTPGGITIKGINELDANGFSTAIVRALKASNVTKI